MTIQYTNAEWDGKKVLIGETDLDPASPVRLLFGFHGADSTPENMLIHGNKMLLSNTVYVFPEGPVDAGKGLWSWWEDGPRQKDAVVRFAAYTTGMIDAAHTNLADKLSGRTVHTSLWGFSQGGAAALTYTLIGTHAIHKAAAVCGFLPEIPDALPERPATDILGIFGTQDDIVPSFLAEHALDEMGAKGHNVTAKETSQGHEINGENLRELTRFFGT